MTVLLFFFQVPRRLGRHLCEPTPLLRRPRLCLPAEVRPRISRCFMDESHSQLMRGSLRIALCAGSTMMICKRPAEPKSGNAPREQHRRTHAGSA